MFTVCETRDSVINCNGQRKTAIFVSPLESYVVRKAASEASKEALQLASEKALRSSLIRCKQESGLLLTT